jgi:hypothetical protein
MASLENLTPEQLKNLATASHRLLSSSEAESFKRLLKKMDPATYNFPELATADLVEKSNEKNAKQIEKIEQEMIQQNARIELERKHAQARDRGLDPAEVEKVVVEKKIYDWDAAMQFVEMLHQSAPASADAINEGAAGSSTRMPTDDDLKELWKNPAEWAAKQAHAEIDELTKRRRAATRR